MCMFSICFKYGEPTKDMVCHRNLAVVINTHKRRLYTFHMVVHDFDGYLC